MSVSEGGGGGVSLGGGGGRLSEKDPLGFDVPEIKIYNKKYKQRNKQNMENFQNNVFQMCGYKNRRRF